MFTMNTMMTIACLRNILLRSLDRSCNDFMKIKRKFCISRPEFGGLFTKRVKSYGKLLIDVPWNVEVKPTDHHEYPNMDTLIVKFSSFNDNNKDVEIEKFLSIDVSEDNICRITAKSDVKFDFSDDARFVVEAPIQYDVDARASKDSDISISGMISDLINAETERGNIVGSKLQGKKIKFNSSQGGSIDLRKSLQGDMEIRTVDNGSIKAEKCLGTSLVMTTESGDINLGSNYCERAIFTTVNGNLHLNNLHMDASVDISGEGSLDITCLDGSLQAKLRDGGARIHIARLTGKSNIISDGPVDLIIPRENNMRLSLRSNKLSADDSLGEARSNEDGIFEGSGEIPLSVETRGNLRVTGSSWAESLRLGKFVK